MYFKLIIFIDGLKYKLLFTLLSLLEFLLMWFHCIQVITLYKWSVLSWKQETLTPDPLCVIILITLLCDLPLNCLRLVSWSVWEETKEQGRQHCDWVRTWLLWWQQNYILGEQVEDDLWQDILEWCHCASNLSEGLYTGQVKPPDHYCFQENTAVSMEKGPLNVVGEMDRCNAGRDGLNIF